MRRSATTFRIAPVGRLLAAAAFGVVLAHAKKGKGGRRVLDGRGSPLIADVETGNHLGSNL